MFVLVVQWTIISLALITLVHYIYSFLIDTMTVPKIRDFVNKPNDRYKEIISKSNKIATEPQQDEMQNELREFLNNIKKDSVSVSDTIQPSNESASYTSY